MTAQSVHKDWIEERALDGSRAIFSHDGLYRYYLERPLPHGKRLIVVNLFALRSTDPRGLAESEDPVGPHCDLWITRALQTAWSGNATVFAMLNPSTADAFANDPTVRRCIGFASGWHGCRVIAAWDAHKMASERDWRFAKVAQRAALMLEAEISCLGRARAGAPRHPLYVPRTKAPEPWAVVRRVNDATILEYAA